MPSFRKIGEGEIEVGVPVQQTVYDGKGHLRVSTNCRGRYCLLTVAGEKRSAAAAQYFKRNVSSMATAPIQSAMISPDCRLWFESHLWPEQVRSQ